MVSDEIKFCFIKSYLNLDQDTGVLKVSSKIQIGKYTIKIDAVQIVNNIECRLHREFILKILASNSKNTDESSTTTTTTISNYEKSTSLVFSNKIRRA